MSIVNRTFSFGRLFACIAPQAAGAPIMDRCFTHEKDGAMRHGTGFMIRPPFTRHRPSLGLVIGRWAKKATAS